jgi:hypothetical protein
MILVPASSCLSLVLATNLSSKKAPCSCHGHGWPNRQGAYLSLDRARQTPTLTPTSLLDLFFLCTLWLRFIHARLIRTGHFGDPLHCPHPAHEQQDGICWGCNCTNGTTPCDVGQTCVWFSQGCSIGCAKCDGLEANPNTHDRCNSGVLPTNNDPKYRTYNRGVKAMSKEDIYMHNPWRRPGNAPVYDACGMAGGSPQWIPTQLSFRNTSHAIQGDLGSKVLPHAPTGIVWRRGEEVEATWSLRANHGGGYQVLRKMLFGHCQHTHARTHTYLQLPSLQSMAQPPPTTTNNNTHHRFPPITAIHLVFHRDVSLSLTSFRTTTTATHSPTRPRAPLSPSTVSARLETTSPRNASSKHPSRSRVRRGCCGAMARAWISTGLS